MNYLIPYVYLYDHEDPILDEFTYGDVDSRARKMKNNLNKDDILFFHISINGKKHITAYYVVERVLDTSEAVKNEYIVSKYRNPHLKEYLQGERREGDDVIVFGDPIFSRKLDKPLLFDKTLAKKLSISIDFKDGFTDNQCIGSATRQWRSLNENDVKTLFSEINLNDSRGLVADTILTTDEVTEIIEKDLENYLEKNHWLLGKSLKIIKRQYDTPVGRIDMLFEDESGRKIIVELKLNNIGRGAINQLRRYMNHLKKETKEDVDGVLVCKGIMPVFEEEFKALKDIKIFRYGWILDIKRLNNNI